MGRGWRMRAPAAHRPRCRHPRASSPPRCPPCCIAVSGRHPHVCSKMSKQATLWRRPHLSACRIVNLRVFTPVIWSVITGQRRGRAAAAACHGARAEAEPAEHVIATGRDGEGRSAVAARQQCLQIACRFAARLRRSCSSRRRRLSSLLSVQWASVQPGDCIMFWWHSLWPAGNGSGAVVHFLISTRFCWEETFSFLGEFVRLLAAEIACTAHF